MKWWPVVGYVLLLMLMFWLFLCLLFVFVWFLLFKVGSSALLISLILDAYVYGASRLPGCSTYRNRWCWISLNSTFDWHGSSVLLLVCLQLRVLYESTKWADKVSPCTCEWLENNFWKARSIPSQYTSIPIKGSNVTYCIEICAYSPESLIATLFWRH